MSKTSRKQRLWSQLRSSSDLCSVKCVQWGRQTDRWITQLPGRVAFFSSLILVLNRVPQWCAEKHKLVSPHPKSSASAQLYGMFPNPQCTENRHNPFPPMSLILQPGAQFSPAHPILPCEEADASTGLREAQPTAEQAREIKAAHSSSSPLLLVICCGAWSSWCTKPGLNILCNYYKLTHTVQN